MSENDNTGFWDDLCNNFLAWLTSTGDEVRQGKPPSLESVLPIVDSMFDDNLYIFKIAYLYHPLMYSGIKIISVDKHHAIVLRYVGGTGRTWQLFHKEGHTLPKEKTLKHGEHEGIISGKEVIPRDIAKELLRRFWIAYDGQQNRTRDENATLGRKFYEPENLDYEWGKPARLLELMRLT